MYRNQPGIVSGAEVAYTLPDTLPGLAQPYPRPSISALNLVYINLFLGSFGSVETLFRDECLPQINRNLRLSLPIRSILISMV